MVGISSTRLQFRVMVYPFEAATELYMRHSSAHSVDFHFSELLPNSNHCLNSHDGAKVQYFLEFDWVHLKPGGGHFEMNSIKAFVELNWIPFFSELANQMGFDTMNGQLLAKHCSDPHKA